jgi:hypothetical protein
MKMPIILLLSSAALLLPVTSFATTSVNISNNDNGSTNRVSIINGQNTSNSASVNQSQGTTDIKIESNGQVKEYHSSGNQDINVSSNDGKSSVSIQNQATPSPTTNTRSSINSSTSVTNEVNGVKSEIKTESSPLPTPSVEPHTVALDSTNEKNAFLRFIDAELAFLNQLKNSILQKIF